MCVDLFFVDGHGIDVCNLTANYMQTCVGAMIFQFETLLPLIKVMNGIYETNKLWVMTGIHSTTLWSVDQRPGQEQRHCRGGRFTAGKTIFKCWALNVPRSATVWPVVVLWQGPVSYFPGCPEDYEAWEIIRRFMIWNRGKRCFYSHLEKALGYSRGNRYHLVYQQQLVMWPKYILIYCISDICDTDSKGIAHHENLARVYSTTFWSGLDPSHFLDWMAQKCGVPEFFCVSMGGGVNRGAAPWVLSFSANSVCVCLSITVDSNKYCMFRPLPTISLFLSLFFE